jgi:hypothetical protein
MVMATQTVPPSLPVGNRSVVLWTLTRQKAIKAIQEQLRAQGERLSYIPIRDIRVFADAYFAEHRRELIEVTKAIVSESPELLKLHTRECAQFMQSAVSPNRTQSTGAQFGLLVPIRCRPRTPARSGLQAIQKSPAPHWL